MKSRLEISMLFFFFIFINVINPATGHAEAPSLLNYQATLTDATGQPVTGQKSMTLNLYNVPTGGTAFWSETMDVTLNENGHFSVTLGQLTPLDKDEFSGTTFIGITIGTDLELAPRQQLTSVAYALQTAGGIPTGGIIMWSGAVENIPTGWVLCDGGNGTPDLRDRFIVGAGNSYGVSASGGVTTVNLNHSHSIGSESPGTNSTGSHGHHIDINLYSGIGDTTDGAQDGSKAVGSESHGHHLVADTQGAGNHAHTVNAHNHGGTSGVQLSATTENRPPYYALAFIMKL